MSFADWTFTEQSAPDGKREWRMSNPADPGQVFYCYAERVKRRDGSEHWHRRYGRTAKAPDLPIADMEEIFRAAYQAHKETRMYTYIKTEPTLWTVGFYKPDGKWEPESDWGSAEEAAERVHYLNGGNS